MEYSSAEKHRGRAIGINNASSPSMLSLPVRSFTTPFEHSTSLGSSRQNAEYSSHQNLDGTPTRRPFNWRDVYPADQYNHGFTNQDYTPFGGHHTDPLQSVSRFSSFTPDSMGSQPDSARSQRDSQSPAQHAGNQANTAAAQVKYDQINAAAAQVNYDQINTAAPQVKYDETNTAAPQVTYEPERYSNLNSPAREPKSVKHLTCFYWRTYGKCNKTEEQCLYAHHLTGQLADEPKHLEPGRPAVAGRNARSKAPVYQPWRRGPDTPYHQSPPRFHANLHGGAVPFHQAYGPGTSFQLNHTQDTMAVFRNPPPNSAIAQRFLNMTLNQSDTHVPKSFHEKQIQTMRDIIELQAHMAKASHDRLVAISEQIKYCREKLTESTATLSAIDKVKPHADTVEALTKQYMTVEREAGAMAEQLKVLEKEVNKEMAAAASVPASEPPS
ncbi:hypothetical protein MMC30_002366 [Trapelia coarctata]|nr:hypothetical protein [Trapelia coarctata]